MAATMMSRTDQVLAAARTTATAITDLQVEQLLQAAEWALLNPGYDRSEYESWAMRPMELAGEGAPTVEKDRDEQDPDETERRRLVATEDRHATLDWNTISSDGIVDLRAGLDITDALNLE